MPAGETNGGGAAVADGTRARLISAAEKLFANTVIETFDVRVDTDSSDQG